jgi:hypothetical protein
MTDNGAEDVRTSVLAETENFAVWQAEEPDDEVTYHLELGNITLHFFQEEWEELLDLLQDL